MSSSGLSHRTQGVIEVMLRNRWYVKVGSLLLVVVGILGGALQSVAQQYWDGTNWGGGNYVALIGDVDGDGKADRVVYERSTGDWGCWIATPNNATKKCGWDAQKWGGAEYVPLLGDVNGDGKADRVVYHRSTGDWGCWMTDGGKCSWDTDDWGGANYTPLLADVNGDGKADRVLYRASDGNWGVRITP